MDPTSRFCCDSRRIFKVANEQPSPFTTTDLPTDVAKLHRGEERDEDEEVEVGCVSDFDMDQDLLNVTNKKKKVSFLEDLCYLGETLPRKLEGSATQLDSKKTVRSTKTSEADLSMFNEIHKSALRRYLNPENKPWSEVDNQVMNQKLSQFLSHPSPSCMMKPPDGLRLFDDEFNCQRRMSGGDSSALGQGATTAISGSAVTQSYRKSPGCVSDFDMYQDLLDISNKKRKKAIGLEDICFPEVELLRLKPKKAKSGKVATPSDSNDKVYSTRKEKENAQVSTFCEYYTLCMNLSSRRKSEFDEDYKEVYEIFKKLDEQGAFAALLAPMSHPKTGVE